MASADTYFWRCGRAGARNIVGRIQPQKELGRVSDRSDGRRFPAIFWGELHG